MDIVTYVLSKKYTDQAVSSSGGNANQNIAEAYSSTSTYTVGDYVIYNGLLYKCTTAVVAAESFDSAKWSHVIVTDEMGSGSGSSAISDLSDVSLSNLANGQILKYNTTTQKWENANESEGSSSDVQLFEALNYTEVKIGSVTSPFTITNNTLTSVASSTSDSETNILSTDTIDLTDIDTIEIILNAATFYQGGNWNGFFYVCDNDTNIRNNTYPSVSHKVMFANTSTPIRYTLDVSQLNGNWYVGVCTGGHTNLVVSAVAKASEINGHTIIDNNSTNMNQRSGLQFTGNVAVSDDSENDKTVINIPQEVVSLTQAQYNALPSSKLTDGKIYCISDSVGGVDGYPPLIYSDEEREIGVWRDGKPLYQKTFELGTLESGQNIGKSLGLVNIDKIFLVMDGSWFTHSGTHFPIPYIHYTSGNLVGILFEVSASDVMAQFRIGSGMSGAVENTILTVRYTKTTDTAGSGIWNGQGGYAHHYSTDEHVIGTWIDGSTLYEKTIIATPTQISNHEYADADFLCTGLLRDD